MDLNNIKKSLLNESHLCSSFDCGDEDLNDFLVNDALNNQKINFSVTRIFEHKNDIIGFYSLVNDSINKSKIAAEDHITEIAYNSYPAIKIGRLAIGRKYQKKGYGNFILTNSIATAMFYSNYVGCRMITVDSKVDAIDFYKKYGFKEAHAGRKYNAGSSVPLYKDLLK